MKKNNILIVEDDPNLGKILQDYLKLKGYKITLAVDGEDGLSKFSKDNFDFIILDIMMPKKDGFSLAKDIREINNIVPILFLTAKNMKENIIKAFKLGADDYLTKPFSMEELILRIKAIQKRVTVDKVNPLPDKFVFSEFIFYHKENLLSIRDKVIKLTTKENELLKLFCLKINKKVNRKEALIKIWGDDSYYNARSMDVYIAKLRKHMKLTDKNVKIITLHGYGFKLFTSE
tara:strand:+ start:379 stop:1074 length:696 start_codon:yes stop_codon:yes gene_type:complete